MDQKLERFESARKERLYEKGSFNLDDTNEKRVNPDIKYYKIVEKTIELKPAVEDKNGKIIAPAITKTVKKGVFSKPYIITGKQYIMDTPFDTSIYGLYSRGIMLRFRSSDKKNIDRLE